MFPEFFFMILISPDSVRTKAQALFVHQRWPRERLRSAGDQQRTFPRVLSHPDERRWQMGSERRRARCRFSSLTTLEAIPLS